MPERIARFFKNLAAALAECVFDAPEMLLLAFVALGCVAMCWLVGSALYEMIFDPHVTTVAALNSLSINPDKWGIH
jgi:hypothetical protein